MRFVVISDTHSLHEQITLPEGDVLLHCGDFSRHGMIREVQSFVQWLRLQQFQHKVVIAGNHELSFDKDHRAAGRPTNTDASTVKKLVSDACIYLEDSLVEINGIRIYGSPYTPEFCNWAFNLPRGPILKQKWAQIPEGVHILMTHGPPYGILDRTFLSKKAGCEELELRIQQLRPRYHVFGHIHEGYGTVTKDGTTFINASTCTLRYRPEHAPVVFDFDPSELTEKSADAVESCSSLLDSCSLNLSHHTDEVSGGP
eukprot:CAMPEP_0184657840 /NCGR_PEP_ID=MMETSP0308-20130426/21993_1 /TAXON_ID=38269 /ORGANISM="Gloeochaete witrockiana, Strain SAG 46.84" /LENGTH=256 /DNA_ID=CAMNT_0027096159 /DNA_START=172 /DNA_END=942 /DNA_ORIENTATION=+